MSTIICPSPSRADVAAALASAVDGDTVVVPAGIVEWTTSLSVNAAITLQGAGIGQTIIQDSLPAGASPSQMLQLFLVAGKLTRVTGIEFASGTRTTAILGGVIRLAGSSSTNGARARVDHCKAVNLNSKFVFGEDAYGVVDHCDIQFKQAVGLAHIRGHIYGDGEWAAADNFGTDNFLYFEDNTIAYTVAGAMTAATDGDGGGRAVFRNNALSNCSIQYHGTESPGRIRGFRAIELYGNHFAGNNSQQFLGFFRGGVGVVYDNTSAGYTTSNAPWKLINFRSQESLVPFSPGNAEAGGADGRNPWDANVAGGPFASGAVVSFSTGPSSSTLTVAGTPWTTDQWKGYSVNRTSGKSVTSLTRSGAVMTATCAGHGFAAGDYVSVRGAAQLTYNDTNIVSAVLDANTFTYGLRTGAGTPATPATGTIIAFAGMSFSEIQGNTSNTLTFLNSVKPGKYLRLAAGDTFELWKVDHAMDQCGRMGGSLVSGDTPIRPGGWNDQTLSPWYAWNNTREGGVLTLLSPDHLVIRDGVHYFNDTVKPGYTAFTYPHPLTSGAVPANAGLAGLTCSDGTLAPIFSSAQSSYTVAVGSGVVSCTVMPTTSDGAASITVNGTAVASGVPSPIIGLAVGDNLITVVVTNGSSTRTYTLTVNRASDISSDATLAGLDLSTGILVPGFSPGSTAFTASVSNSTATITVTPTCTNAGATVTVNGVSVTSGMASGNIDLSVGSNTIVLQCIAANGTTTRTVTLTVTRGAAANADLSDLTLSDGTLVPDFFAVVLNYAVSVTAATIDITPTLADASASMTVNGISAASAAPTTVSLRYGANTVVMDITAQDGTRKRIILLVMRLGAPGPRRKKNVRVNRA